MEGQVPLVVERIAKWRRITLVRLAGIELLHGPFGGNIPGVDRLALRPRDGRPLLYRYRLLDPHIGQCRATRASITQTAGSASTARISPTGTPWLMATTTKGTPTHPAGRPSWA